MGSHTVLIEGRHLKLTNLDKVLYPVTGTTKADVLAYLSAVGQVLIPHAANRPVTRKRWPDGVDGQVFFHKNLGAGTPSWVRQREIQHSGHTNTYPLVNDLPTLAWLGQIGALEIHVPQWQFGRTGTQLAPDRLVLDLDPGPGTGLAQCAQVARWARQILLGMGLDPYPVTSGSKGIHLYAALNGAPDAAATSAVARELALFLQSEHPDLVVADMKRSLRDGKVLVDWSQNNPNKTTIAPYSLRGRDRPMVAAPRTWDELDDPGLAQLDKDEVMARVAEDGDLLAPLLHGHLAALEPTSRRLATFARLETYQAKRDPARTPEPMPSTPPAGAPSPGSAGPGASFVIQEHHARRLHWDFRLERDGVLVSWALPKGEPTDPGANHLAIQTEDHPLEYGTFEGEIPAGEYGGGTVSIWDAGTYETEKWRDDEEVIVTLHGERHGTRRLALIHTRGPGPQGWLIHLMAPRAGSPEPSPNPPDPPNPPASPPPGEQRIWRPMLATAASAPEDDDSWSFEMKWDGFRAFAEVSDQRVILTSRSGMDMSGTFPELQAIAQHIPSDRRPAVLDGEIVALDATGRPSFRLLQQRANLTRPGDVAAVRHRVPVEYMAFDVVEVSGEPVAERSYDERRAVLASLLAGASTPVHVPPAFEGDLQAALATSRALGVEGIVAKRRNSPYVGRRSESWRKIKHVRTQEVVVVGWRPGHGDRGHLLGSLLLAVPDGAGLRYAGRVGSGFTDAERRAIPELLTPANAPAAEAVPDEDARDAHWVRPDRVAEVSFAHWTGQGTGDRGKLRHPVWRGWRGDKSAGDVVVEEVTW